MKKQIDFFAFHYEFTWWPTDLLEFLPGTESWLVELAEAFVRAGHGVTIYWHQGRLDYHGVHYRNIKEYDNKSQIAIIWNDLRSSPHSFDAATVLYWTNGPESYGYMSQQIQFDYEPIDWIVGLCEWHAEELRGNIPHAAEKIIHIYPGLDPLEFAGEPQVRRKNLFLYASSWDRGLEKLASIWPKIYRKTKGELLVTYGKEFSEKVVKGKIKDPKIALQDGVTMLGQCTRAEMARFYQQAEILLYPCDGEERFCLTVWKSQYAGCIPLTTPHMALQETNVMGIQSDIEEFEETAIGLAGSSSSRKSFRDRRVSMKFPTWDEITVQWEQLFESHKKIQHSPRPSAPSEG